MTRKLLAAGLLGCCLLESLSAAPLAPDSLAQSSSLIAPETAQPSDSVTRGVRPPSQLFQASYLGAPLIGLGLVSIGSDPKFRRLRSSFFPSFRRHEDDYLQFLPAAVLVGLKAAGVQGRSSWKQMLLSDAISVGLMAASVNTLKYAVARQRPDGSARNSFPSGHTATAFMTATMLNKEYGHLSPWIGIGAYSVAASTGLMRMANNKHWLSDILAGAGLGILSVEFGYWLSDAILGRKSGGVRAQEHWEELNPSFCSLLIGLTLPLNQYKLSEGSALYTSTGATTGLEGAYFFDRHWGFGGRLAVSNVRLKSDEGVLADHTLDVYSFMPGVYFTHPLSARWSLGAKLLGGFMDYRQLDLKGVRINRQFGLGVSTGFSVDYRIRRHLGLRLVLDYALMPPHNRAPRAYKHILMFGGSTAIHF